MIGRTETVAEHVAARFGWSWHGGARTAAVFAVVITSCAAAALWRGRGEPRAASRAAEVEAWRGGQIAAAATAIALASHVAMFARFRFVHDDFLYLERGAQPLVEPDPSLRWLSTDVLFALGVETGGHGLFILANALALVVCLVAFAAWTRSAGARGAELALATALFASGRAPLDLVRSPSNFQQLLGSAVVCAALATADALLVAPSEARLRRRGLAASLASLGVLGAVVKFDVAAIAVPAVFVWGCVVRRRLRAAVHAATCAATGLGLTLLLAHPARLGELEKAGTARWGSNLREALRVLGDVLSPWCVVLALTLTTFVCATASATRVRSRSARLVIAARGAWSGLLNGGSERIGCAPAWLVCSALYLTLQAPYLLNAHYFPPYYVWLPSAPFALLAARVITRSTAGGRAARVTALLGGLVLASIAGVSFRASRPGTPYNDVERWASSFRAIAGHRAAPAIVRVTVACSALSDVERSQQALEELWSFGSNGAALNWATGWHRTNFELGRPTEAGPTVKAARIGWCAGQAPTWLD